MTPLEAAAEKAIPRERGSVTPTPGDYETARRVITAFLEAAAAQQSVCWMVAEAFVEAEKPFGDTGSAILDDAGKAAILALKETING